MFCKFGFDDFTNLLSIFIPFLINVKTTTVTTKVKAKNTAAAAVTTRKNYSKKQLHQQTVVVTKIATITTTVASLTVRAVLTKMTTGASVAAIDIEGI
jgi:hypothetical protein